MQQNNKPDLDPNARLQFTETARQLNDVFDRIRVASGIAKLAEGALYARHEREDGKLSLFLCDASHSLKGVDIMLSTAMDLLSDAEDCIRSWVQ